RRRYTTSSSPRIGLIPTFFFLWKPNAQAHLLPEAEARHERTLEAVRCSALFGAFPGLSSPQFPISLRASGLSRFASERLRLSRESRAGMRLRARCRDRRS